MVSDPDHPAVSLALSHDGYRAPFGVVHVRRLVLDADGARLSGSDTMHAAAPARTVVHLPRLLRPQGFAQQLEALADFQWPVHAWRF